MKQISMLDLRREYEYMKDDIEVAIRKCLDHQQWIMGPEVKELEGKIAEYLGVKYCIGVASGTDALVISLRALAIKLKGEEYFSKEDEIVTTPFTFTATGDAILRAGATPVFVDIDPRTFNLDAIAAEEYLRRYGKKVAGIIPVHLYGQACALDKIMETANSHHLFVIEDVAQALGGMWKDKKLGSIGAAGCFSFFPSKNLGGFGDGGMIATNDEEIASLSRMLRVHGGKDKYNVEHVGYKSRLDTLQAAILLAKYKYLDEFNTRRREIAKVYNNELKGIEEIVLPEEQPSACHVYHQYTIRVKNGKREKLKQFLQEKGISSMVYYPLPLNKMKVFQGRCRIHGDLSETEKAAEEVLSLPVEPLLAHEDVAAIAQAIKDFFKKDK